MREIFLFSLTFILFINYSFSQKKTDGYPSLLHYGQAVAGFFKGYHEANYSSILDSINSEAGVEVLFNIDTSGNIINLRYSEPIGFSDTISIYLTGLLMATNGLWAPAMIDCKKIISKDFCIYFRFSFKKSDPLYKELITSRRMFNNLYHEYFNNYSTNTYVLGSRESLTLFSNFVTLEIGAHYKKIDKSMLIY